MKEIKIYKALTYLNAYQLNSFRKFLLSPYFNKNALLTDLLEFYVGNITKEEEAKITEDTIVKQVDLGKDINLKTLRRYNNDLLKLLSDFLAIETAKQDKLLYNNLKFKGISNLNAETLYSSVKRSNSRDLDLYSDSSANYFFAKYMHEKISSELKSMDQILKSKANIQEEITIDKVSYNLDQFYIIEKLKLYITLLSWQKSYKMDKEIHHIDEIKNILAKQADRNEVILAYLTIIKTLEEPDKPVYFEMLRSQVRKHKDQFTLEDFRYIYEALTTYSVTAMNKGNDNFIAISFDVYKEGLKVDALLTDGILSEVTFNNIIAISCRNQETKWADQFINEYSMYLDPKNRKNTVTFASARVQFYEKNFSNVIDILREVEYETVIYNLNSKSLLLFSYFEMDEYDALDSLINSFKVYLNRERSISASRKKRYNQLLGFVKRIATVNPRDRKKTTKLRVKLVETKGVLNKSWLLEKLDELDKK